MMFNIPESSNLEVLGRFHANDSLLELHLPRTIREIRGTPELERLTIAAPNPPQVNLGGDSDYLFGIIVPEKPGVILVPAESLNTYEDAWFHFPFTFNGQLAAMR